MYLEKQNCKEAPRPEPTPLHEGVIGYFSILGHKAREWGGEGDKPDAPHTLTTATLWGLYKSAVQPF